MASVDIPSLGSSHFKVGPTPTPVAHTSFPEIKVSGLKVLHQNECFEGNYPLVNIQKAMENGHRNSGFSH